jgi:integrase
LVLPAVKGQAAMVTYLTRRQRAAIDAALATYLATWEAAWQADGTDYPLIPGGRGDRALLPEPISDRALRKVWPLIEAAAGVESRDRLGFHGARRSWADDIEEGEGLDTVTAAGGWSRRETPETLYVSRRKYGHLEKARKRREREP